MPTLKKNLCMISQDDCSLEVYSSSNTLPGDDIDLPFDLLDAISKSLPENCIKLGHVVKHIDWSEQDNIKVTQQFFSSSTLQSSPSLTPLGRGPHPLLGVSSYLGLGGTCKQCSPSDWSIALVVLKVARVGFLQLHSRVYDDICQTS